MTAPLATPLLSVSAYNAAVNQAETTRLLDQIVHASALLQGACHRRFDEYVEAKRFTAKLTVKGGDLLDWYRLSLNADLRSLSLLETDIAFGGASGSGTPVTAAYELIAGEWISGAPSNSGRELALDEIASTTSFLTTLNPRKSIGVNGLWGFGGQWVNSGATVTGLDVSTSATAATVSSATNIEVGQVWRVGTEYLYVNNLASSVATVDRAYNGSTAALHVAATAVYYWQAHPLVQKLVRRLVQWDEEQKKSPMAQNVVIGDFTLPAATAGLPKDVFDTISITGLLALPEWIVKA